MGFVQETSFTPQFSMTLFCEKQLECVHAIPELERVVHIDASGTFVNISKKTGFVYQRILNYAMVMTDDRREYAKNYVVIGEMVSSTHDVYSISKFTAKFKFEYERLYKKDLVFKLVVMDYSFAMLHAVLQTLNHETVEEYANRVFKFSSNMVSQKSRQTSPKKEK
jgi:hypothetical protein